MMRSEVTNNLPYQYDTHHEVNHAGYFTDIARSKTTNWGYTEAAAHPTDIACSKTTNWGYTATPAHPTVILRQIDPKTWKSTTRGLMMVVPADDSVVKSSIVLVNGELTVRIECTDKNPETPVRFLLGNFSHTESLLFKVSNGSEDLLRMVIPPRQYNKIPGTSEHKEIVACDTGLRTSSAIDQGRRPTNDVCFHITISTPEDTEGFLEAIEENQTVELPSIEKRTTLYADHSDGGRECPDSAVEDDSDETSCIVTTGPNNVGYSRYKTTTFYAGRRFESKMYFTKTVVLRTARQQFSFTSGKEHQRAAAKDEDRKRPQFTVCRNSMRIVCEHKSHNIKPNDPFETIELMRCPCVSDDAAKWDAGRLLRRMGLC